MAKKKTIKFDYPTPDLDLLRAIENGKEEEYFSSLENIWDDLPDVNRKITYPLKFVSMGDKGNFIFEFEQIENGDSDVQM